MEARFGTADKMLCEKIPTSIVDNILNVLQLSTDGEEEYSQCEVPKKKVLFYNNES